MIQKSSRKGSINQIRFNFFLNLKNRRRVTVLSCLTPSFIVRQVFLSGARRQISCQPSKTCTGPGHDRDHDQLWLNFSSEKSSPSNATATFDDNKEMLPRTQFCLQSTSMQKLESGFDCVLLRIQKVLQVWPKHFPWVG